jgi:hypothetical protein
VSDLDWTRQYIARRLQARYVNLRVGACREAWIYGFEVSEIVELSGLPEDVVRTQILRKQ